MAELHAFPDFEIMKPCNGPPVAPFQWRRINMGPVDFDFLFDARGQQIFNRSSAVYRMAGSTEVIWPEREAEAQHD